MHPRQTVDRALRLSAMGLTDREAAKSCGVSLGAVRKWRSGARRSRRKTPGRPGWCPHCHGRPLDREGYAYLLGLYLGDGHIVLAPKSVYRLTISCGDTCPA